MTIAGARDIQRAMQVWAALSMLAGYAVGGAD